MRVASALVASVCVVVAGVLLAERQPLERMEERVTDSVVHASGNRPLRSSVLSGYHLTFEDNFTSLSISDRNDTEARWYTHTVQCCMTDTSSPGTPTHMAGITDGDGENPFVLIPGGGLRIRLQRHGGAWYSGVLATVDANGKGFAQKYGYFEMKARFPKAVGTWPAFWLLNSAALAHHAPPGEIDIVEAYMFAPRYINTTLHDWTPPGKTIAHHLSRVGDLSDGFHTFGMLWTAKTMSFYCDDNLLYEVPTPPIMHQPFYPIVDLGLGGGWPTAETPERADLDIEYVRVYAQ